MWQAALHQYVICECNRPCGLVYRDCRQNVQLNKTMTEFHSDSSMQGSCYRSLQPCVWIYHLFLYFLFFLIGTYMEPTMVKIFLEVKGHPCITPMSTLPLQPHAVLMRCCRKVPGNPRGPFHYIFAENIVWSIKQASIHVINLVLLMLGAVNSQHLDSVPPSITLYPPPAPPWSHHHTPANSPRRTSRCRSEPSPCVQSLSVGGHSLRSWW